VAGPARERAWPAEVFISVGEEIVIDMPTMEENRQAATRAAPRAHSSADDRTAVIRGQSEAALGRRPDARNWAAKEVICRLRDIEEHRSAYTAAEFLVG
jgi:hypothetical protein